MWCSALRTVILHFGGFACSQGPGYLLESWRQHLWFGFLIFLLSGHQLWGASRWGWAERKSEGLLFFFQEVPSSLTPIRAMVAAAPPEVSQIARDTPYRGCHMGQMHFNPSWVFWFCLTPHVASCWEGVGGLAGSSADAAEMVTQVTNSSWDVAGVAIGVADMFYSTDCAMAKTAGLSATGGSMGLGWVVS